MQICKFDGKYSFLSNFYPCKVIYDGMRYPSVEHAYQAAKTNNVSDRKYIACCESAKAAKRFGKKVDLIVDYLQLVKWPKMQISKQLYQAIVDIMESQSYEFKDKKGYAHLGEGRVYAGKRRLELYSYKSPYGGVRLNSEMLPNNYRDIAHNLHTEEFEERIWVGDADHISISNCVVGVIVPKSAQELSYRDEWIELQDALIKCSGDCKILTY